MLAIRNLSTDRRQAGAAYLIMAAFITTVLIIVAALGVDIAQKYRLEQLAQDVADHAAMAGASALPSEPMARDMATKVIMNHASTSYVPDSDDIQVAVSADISHGTVGVIVYGSWDATFMPMWITGDPNYGISRYAIATANWTSGVDSSSLTIDGKGFGDLALFIGDTPGAAGQPACGAEKEALVNGNNFSVTGNTQINHDLLVNGTADFNGAVSISGSNNSTDPGVDFNAGVTTGAPVREMPQLDESQFNMDVFLDWTNADVAAQYPVGVEVALVAAGPDGDLGTGDDIPILAANNACNAQEAVIVKYNGLDGFGHQLWDLKSGNNKRINSACFNTAGTLGAGFDLRVNGDVTMTELDGWDGFVWTDGSLTLAGSMNADFKGTTDNPGMVIYTGPPGDPTKESFLVNANLSQESFVGLIYVDGNVKFDGNGSNNENTINGGLWARRMDADCAGGLNGNNWGITGNSGLIGDVLVLGTPDAAIQGSPDVALFE